MICKCNEGDWRPLHVRILEGGLVGPYLTDDYQKRATWRRSWTLRYDTSIGPYIFYSLTEAKRAMRVPVIKQWTEESPDDRVEISCHRCQRTVWPKNVLVQLAEQA